MSEGLISSEENRLWRQGLICLFKTKASKSREVHVFVGIFVIIFCHVRYQRNNIHQKEILKQFGYKFKSVLLKC